MLRKISYFNDRIDYNIQIKGNYFQNLEQQTQLLLQIILQCQSEGLRIHCLVVLSRLPRQPIPSIFLDLQPKDSSLSNDSSLSANDHLNASQYSQIMIANYPSILLINLQFSTEQIMKEVQHTCESLLKECQNSETYHSQSRLKQYYGTSQLKRKISSSKMMSKISPQQEEENNKIIEKMRKKYHKKQKESSIKKTDLGEDLLTFTKEEFQKLQFIDECQEKNIVYRETIQPFGQENVEKISAVDRLKKMAKIDDIIDEIKVNLQWADIKELQEKKYFLRSKETKCFLKRTNQHHSTKAFKKLGKDHKDQKVLNAKHSLQKYYHTLLNKNSFNKNFLNSEPSWTRHTQNPLTFAEKAQLIKDEANKTMLKLCANKSQYMTEQRRNALYQCQILRLSKKMLGDKQFQNLHFCLNQTQCEVEKEEMNGDSSIEKDSKNCEAEEILQKNHRRIKQERKRIIQKLLC